MANRFTPRPDLYQQTTDAICAALEAGTVPWRRPWSPDAAAPSGPVNATTGKAYRGINVLMLGMNPLTFTSGDPRWCSYKQAADKGWQVRKGEKAATVFFFKTVEIDAAEGDDDDKRTVPVLRSYPVFHASQMDNIPAHIPPTTAEAPWRAPEAAEVILTNSGVPVREGGSRAFYSPAADFIQLPPRATFIGPAEWAATAMHELGHATAHPSRLDRTTGNPRFGSRDYAAEELRAELASAFIGAQLNIPSDLANHASYVDSWLASMRADRREIFRAAADAQRIADWCLARHPDYAAAMTEDATPEDAPTEPTPAVPAAVAAMGPMPRHISKSLKLEPAVAAVASAPTPEETASWTYAPR
jgi:antirestriction protein ArdC